MKGRYQGISRAAQCGECGRHAPQFLMTAGRSVWWQCSDCNAQLPAGDDAITHGPARGQQVSSGYGKPIPA